MDLRDLIADDERVRLRFPSGMPVLGCAFLDAGHNNASSSANTTTSTRTSEAAQANANANNSNSLNSSPDLPAGSEPAVPIWLAAALAQHGMVRCSLPACFRSSRQPIASLRADPAAVPLAAVSPVFIDAAAKADHLNSYQDKFNTHKLKQSEHASIEPILHAAAGARLAHAQAIAQHSLPTTDASADVGRLTWRERDLFNAARLAANNSSNGSMVSSSLHLSAYIAHDLADEVRAEAAVRGVKRARD